MSSRLVKFFRPEHPDKDPEFQRRLTLVTHAMLITAAFSLFYVSVSALSGYAKGVSVMFFTFLGIVLLLLLLKWGVNMFVLSFVFGVVCTNAIFLCAWYSGGLYSPVLPWLTQPPIVLLLISGRKGGYFSAALSLILTLVISILAFFDYNFSVEYDPAKKNFLFLACYSGLVLIIFLITLVFEILRLQALQVITEKSDALQLALTDLKAAQTQLIQSEKMASLGELTAGIAHEIQNPLNFIINFADLSNELLIEIKEEIDTDNKPAIQPLMVSLEQNLQKITHHGKRADTIVKGMLQHSRSSSGIKESTDINILSDEFLRLSYHGLRAKDKSFNVTLETSYDQEIRKIEIMPQEIGRVLLNLFNNAFYAVSQKKKNAEQGYVPTVKVTTKKLEGQVLLSVRDNGHGIPAKMLDKIYQPFFTTKPSGEGTGLGLSLSYDIITRLHQGALHVQSEEGRFTEFQILLPA